MKTTLITSLLLVSLTACTVVKSGGLKKTTVKSPDGTVTETVESIDFKARSTWDAKNALNKAGLAQTKTGQKIGIDGLVEESSGSNIVNLVEGVTAAAVGAAIKAAK